ncbi:MAG: hypothetical protein J6333_12755 [Planctomycetes bacterium]|nr:hypothetical protein [Planctomycetota bacterium]
MKTNYLRLSCLCLSLLLPLLLCGCYEEMGALARTTGRAAYGAQSKSYEEFPGDPVALATTKTVLFIPFEYNGMEEGFDTMVFTTRLANQVATQAELRVLYPRDILKLTQLENRRIEQKNRRLAEMMSFGDDLGALPRDERTRGKMLDPVVNIDDAIKLGRQLKADAVVMGIVSDWSPYMRPRMCVTMQIIATGNSDTAAVALQQMTQWGVPRMESTARGVVWFIQQNFDARDPDIGRNVWVYGMTKHTEENVYDKDIYIRAISNFYDYVGSALGRELLRARKKAISEAEKRALAQAQKQQLAAEGVRNRIRTLTDPFYTVPDAQAVSNQALADKRAYGWRPDIYNLEHQDKKRLLNTHVDPRLVQEQFSAMRGNPPVPDANASDLPNQFMSGQQGLNPIPSRSATPLPAGVDF